MAHPPASMNLDGKEKRMFKQTLTRQSFRREARERTLTGVMWVGTQQTDEEAWHHYILYTNTATKPN